jgi:hypothetical protein
MDKKDQKDQKDKKDLSVWEISGDDSHCVARKCTEFRSTVKRSEGIDPEKNTVDKTGHIRFDFLFSYWIIIWFLIYYFSGRAPHSSTSDFIKTYLNPTVAILFALAENLFTFILLLFYSSDIWVFIKYISMIFLMKGIPLYLLRNSKVHVIRDLEIFIIIFGIYLVYLFINDENLVTIYKRTFYFVSTNQSNTPLFSVYSWISSNFFRVFPHS